MIIIIIIIINSNYFYYYYYHYYSCYYSYSSFGFFILPLVLPDSLQSSSQLYLFFNSKYSLSTLITPPPLFHGFRFPFRFLPCFCVSFFYYYGFPSLPLFVVPPPPLIRYLPISGGQTPPPFFFFCLVSMPYPLPYSVSYISLLLFGQMDYSLSTFLTFYLLSFLTTYPPPPPSFLVFVPLTSTSLPPQPSSFSLFFRN